MPEFRPTADLTARLGRCHAENRHDNPGMWDEVVEWLLRLGDDYGVNPVVYAVIYVGALPFLLLSLSWLVRTRRRREHVALPALSAAFFFLAPTLYVVVAARNMPVWVYAVLLILTVIGAVMTFRRVRARTRRPNSP